MGASENSSSGLPPFLTKTYEMVDDPGTNPIVSWSSGNNSFVVWNSLEFARVLLPTYFKHNNFSSFVRQLNTYGFRKIDPDRWEFANEGFLRGHKHLLKSIHRRKPIHSHSQQQVESSSAGLCIEELEEDVERLKQEKHVLLMELVRVRERQQGTELHLQSLGERLEAMEQRQQQMMSFLAKAMKNPGFLAPIFQNKENSGRLVAANKKRRLPEQGNNLQTLENRFGDVQIVKWRPVMDDPAKTVLLQISNTDSSNKPDSSSDTSENDSFYDLGNAASTEAMNDGSHLSRSSGITVTEMHGKSGITDISLELSDIHTTSALSDVNSSSGLPEMPATSRLPNMQASSGLVESISCDTPCLELLSSPLEFGKMDSVEMVIPQGNAECVDSMGSKTGSIGALAMEAGLSNDASKVSLERVTGVGMDVGCTKTGVNDVFWQQFLTERPGSTDAEEADSKI